MAFMVHVPILIVMDEVIFKNLLYTTVTAHTLSILKTNAVAWGSSKSSVGSPKGHHSRASKVSYNAIGAPRACTRVVVQTPWSSVAFAWRLYGVL